MIDLFLDENGIFCLIIIDKFVNVIVNVKWNLFYLFG